MGTEEVVEGVPDSIGRFVEELGVVTATFELSISDPDVVPGLTVTVDDGKMLTTGMVEIPPGLVLLLSIRVNDREIDVEEVGTKAELEPESVGCEGVVVADVIVEVGETFNG